MDIALTDKDIENLCRKIHEHANILFLPRIESTVANLDDLFKGQDHIILFVATTGEYNGHWQAVFKTPEKIYFFDSYGHNFTVLLRKVFKNFGKDAHGESYKFGQIIADSDYFKQGKVIMNTKQYQAIGPEVNTCGRHVCVALMVFQQLKDDFDFYKYAEFMNNYRSKNGLESYDDCVIQITNKMVKIT